MRNMYDDGGVLYVDIGLWVRAPFSRTVNEVIE